jgi:hypothetical protein
MASFPEKTATASGAIAPTEKAQEPAEVTDLKLGEIEDLDQAEVFLREHNYSHAQLQDLLADETAVKKVRRRVDWILMPLLCGTYSKLACVKGVRGYNTC